MYNTFIPASNSKQNHTRTEQEVVSIRFIDEMQIKLWNNPYKQKILIKRRNVHFLRQ